MTQDDSWMTQYNLEEFTSFSLDHPYAMLNNANNGNNNANDNADNNVNNANKANNANNADE